MGEDHHEHVVQINKRSVDDLINEIGKSPNFMVFLIATAAMSCSMVGTFCAYMIKFTGVIPEWMCMETSEKCVGLRKLATDSHGVVNPEFYNIKTVCENDLGYGSDYRWNSTRASLASDFDIVCKESDLNLLSSLYFVGGTAGLFVGSWAFERFGRRKTSLTAGLICFFGTSLGFVCQSYSFMVVIRLMQGMGNFVCYAGCYIWVLEFAAENIRVYYNSWSMMLWVFGYPALSCVSYLIPDWHYIHLASGGIFLLTYIPLMVLPDSPRYLLSIGKAEEAKNVLRRYAKLAGVKINLDEIELQVEEKKNENADGWCRGLKTFQDMFEHKGMLLETVVQCYAWFTVCLLFYGLNYGWSQFGDTPYVNYLFAGLGEGIAYVLLIPVTKYAPRRVAIPLTCLTACLCFLLGMIDWRWSAVWNFERLTAMVAIVMIAIAFAMIFLWAAEIAPTTARGFVLSACSITARGAAFLGPFSSQISPNHRVILGINALLAGTTALLMLLLPETRGKPLVETPAEVSRRRSNQNLNSLTTCRLR